MSAQRAGAPLCRCGHTVFIHTHWRAGTDCGQCGRTRCASYRPGSRLRRAWQWWRRRRHQPEPARVVNITRPRPLPPDVDDNTRFDLRVPGYIDTGKKPRGAHHRSQR